MLRPDYGLPGAIAALWPFRQWKAQRHVLRIALREARTLRDMRREDERMADFERTIFLLEMDNYEMAADSDTDPPTP